MASGTRTRGSNQGLQGTFSLPLDGKLSIMGDKFL